MLANKHESWARWAGANVNALSCDEADVRLNMDAFHDLDATMASVSEHNMD